MKTTKRIKALLMAAVMLLSLMLCACGESTPNTDETTGKPVSKDPAYRVTVVDGQGKPFTSGVIVKFMQNGQQAAMQKVDKNGVAEKNLPAGEYTVELMFTDSDAECYYDKENLTLTAEKTEVQVALYFAAEQEGRNLVVQGKEYTAYFVNAGGTYVNLTGGDRNYFLFSPTEAGTYQFSAVGEGLQIGYYGAPHFVQQNNIAEDLNGNIFTQSVSQGMIGTGNTGTATFVIGIDAMQSGGAVLNINRIGEPAWSISDEPFTEYQLKQPLKPFQLTLQAGQKLTYVDIKADADQYKAVYNETDGYYHLGTADGPVLYMNLGTSAPHISLQTVVGGNGYAGGAAIRKYFFDDNNNFVRKEDYTKLLTEFFANMDEEYGLYPMTEDLKYIVVNGCSGWWEADSPNYIFEGCTEELGWLFACCYIEG